MPRPTERRGETRAAADFVRGREIPGFGLGVPATLSFGEAVEARVARIDPAPIRDAALETGRTPGLDAIFLSCTKLRTPDIIDALERRLGLPVVSSDQALAWHMALHAAVSAAPKAPGRLLRRSAP